MRWMSSESQAGHLLGRLGTAQFSITISIWPLFTEINNQYSVDLGLVFPKSSRTSTPSKTGQAWSCIDYWKSFAVVSLTSHGPAYVWLPFSTPAPYRHRETASESWPVVVAYFLSQSKETCSQTNTLTMRVTVFKVVKCFICKAQGCCDFVLMITVAPLKGLVWLHSLIDGDAAIKKSAPCRCEADDGAEPFLLPCRYYNYIILYYNWGLASRYHHTETCIL